MGGHIGVSKQQTSFKSLNGLHMLTVFGVVTELTNDVMTMWRIPDQPFPDKTQSSAAEFF